jgi:predicted negative regulator of RcsB-dependent stress response
MDSQTRPITSEELVAEAEAWIRNNPHDQLAWLMAERNLEVAKRNDAFKTDSIVAANQHDNWANKLEESIREIMYLRKVNAAMQKALVSRVIVALNEAQQPAWKATHQHYKGTLYRVTGTRGDARGEELVAGVDYDDAAGNRYFLDREKWESRLESGKLRYRPLVPGEG